MASRILPSQPVQFGISSDPCTCDGQPFCQPVEQGDTLTWQDALVFNDPDSGWTNSLMEHGYVDFVRGHGATGFINFTFWNAVNLVTNGTFAAGTTGWIFDASWAVVAGKAEHTAGVVDGIRQNGVVEAGRYYRVGWTQGYATNDPSRYLTAYLGANYVTGLSSPGTVSVSILAEDSYLKITANAALDISRTVDNVTVYSHGWYLSGNSLVHYPDNTTPASYTPQIMLPDWTYKIIYKISGRTQGSVTVSLSGTPGTTQTSNGEKVEYIKHNIVNPESIVFTPSSDFNGQIDYVYVYEAFPQSIIFIKDSAGNYLSEVSDSFSEIVEDVVIWQVPVSYLDLSDGCYSLCRSAYMYNSPIELLDGGAMSTITQNMTIQSIQPYLIYGGIIVEFIASGGSANPQLLLVYNSDLLTVGKTYNISLDFTVYSASTQVYCTVVAGTTSSGAMQTGIYSFDIVCTGNGLLSISVSNLNLADAEEGYFGFQITEDVSNLTTDGCTGCIDVRASHECTNVLSWYNIENSYGMIYDTGYVNKLRVKSKLWKSKHQKEKKVFRFSNGYQRVLYANDFKKENLSIEDAPAHIHDAIALAVDHDYFIIGGDHYIAEEEDYTPDWRNSSTSAPATIEVEKNFQKEKENKNYL